MGEKRLKGEDPFVIAMAMNKTVREAAEEAGLHWKSGYRLMRHPRVKARIEEMRRHASAAAATALSESGTAAVGRLLELLGSEVESVALQAAKAILDYGIRLRQESSIEDRLNRLEEFMATGVVSRAQLPVEDDDEGEIEEVEDGQ